MHSNGERVKRNPLEDAVKYWFCLIGSAIIVISSELLMLTMVFYKANSTKEELDASVIALMHIHTNGPVRLLHTLVSTVRC